MKYKIFRKYTVKCEVEVLNKDQTNEFWNVSYIKSDKLGEVLNKERWLCRQVKPKKWMCERYPIKKRKSRMPMHRALRG